MPINLVEVLSHPLKEHTTEKTEVILALSGGLDSRVLLDILQCYLSSRVSSITAVHIHHGLSVKANLWAQKCASWCEDANVPLYVERVKLDNRRLSLEQAARNARYQALGSYVGENAVLITGHHSDDQTETFLLALKRGSGPKGLASMATCVDFGPGKMLRPLLHTSRQEIEEYARERNLDWVHDKSNDDIRFDRNYIRHRVTPLLKRRWPHIQRAISRSAQLCAQQESVLSFFLRDELHQAQQEDKGLSLIYLSKRPYAVRLQLIRFWLAQARVQMPSQRKLLMIWEQVAQAKREAKPRLRLGNHQIWRFNGALYCVALAEDLSQWRASIIPEQPRSLPSNVGYVMLTKQRQPRKISNHILRDSLSVIFNPDALKIRLNHQGAKTLSYWFYKHKIPLWEQRRIPILMSGTAVVSVGEIFINQEFRGKDWSFIWEKSLLSHTQSIHAQRDD